MQIELKHGAGGAATDALIGSLFAKYFQNEVLSRMEDGAVLPELAGSPVLTTDSFVVTPLFFPGGDIGRLAVCGTVNDLACMGARPLYLTAAFILEEGLNLEVLEQVVQSMAATAREAGVQIVAGDTKVVERRHPDAATAAMANTGAEEKTAVTAQAGADAAAAAMAKVGTNPAGTCTKAAAPGLFINTTGLGLRPVHCQIGASQIRPGDKILVSGTLGDHHGCILATRLGLQTSLQSDCAPLNKLVAALLTAGIDVHTVRDMTRGGMATVVNELAAASGCRLVLEEKQIPVREGVTSLCGLLGLEPYTMGNEGKLVLAVPAEQAGAALALLQAQTYGREAAIIGSAHSGSGVFLHTALGGLRNLPPLRGEGLPRIC